MALALIGKHGLPTNPLNYCIWYEYVSDKNRALIAAMDGHLKSKAAFSDEVSKQLYEEHIAGERENVTSVVREELKKLFAEVADAIKDTKQHFTSSEDKLGMIDKSLIPGLSEADVDAIVRKIKKEIKLLEKSSTSFNEQLKQATVEIDQLKSKMAHYRQEAIRDPLTRIANRRGFEKKLNHAIRQTNDERLSLCLIMLDIDHFKKVNDTHGHLVGDNVLRMVANTIKDSIKGKDLVARIGGEEFAILLPDTPFDGALKLAETLRRTFERLDLKKKNTGESLGKITLSLGVTAYNTGENDRTFVNRADEALYQSKNSGRNKVTGK
jgi:diguanylate cyclase